MKSDVYDKLMKEKYALIDETARIIKEKCGEKNVLVVRGDEMEDLCVGIPYKGIYPCVKCFGYSSLYGAKVYLKFECDEKPTEGDYHEAYHFGEDAVGLFAYLNDLVFSLDDIALMHDYIVRHYGEKELPTMEEVANATDTSRHPLVGRRMKPTDNDYIREVETNAKGYLRGVEVIILCKPYVKDVDGKKRFFVKAHALDSGFDYEVPYKDEWLIKELS